VTADRYHLTLFSGDRPAQQGWWADRATAERKFTAWVGSEVADARVVLVDTADGTVIHRWPDET
jgi:hypothetical protein